MAYGKIKSDALIYDNSGTDVEITISTIPTAAQVAAKADTSALNAKANTSDIGSTIQAFDADTAKTDTAQTFTAAQRATITTLTDGATVTPDFATSNNYTLTLGGNRTIANPTNLTAGQSGSIFLVQDLSLIHI